MAMRVKIAAQKGMAAGSGQPKSAPVFTTEMIARIHITVSAAMMRPKTGSITMDNMCDTRSRSGALWGDQWFRTARFMLSLNCFQSGQPDFRHHPLDSFLKFV